LYNSADRMTFTGGPVILEVLKEMQRGLRDSKKVSPGYSLAELIGAEMIQFRLLRPWRRHGRRSIPAIRPRRCTAQLLALLFIAPPNKVGSGGALIEECGVEETTIRRSARELVRDLAKSTSTSAQALETFESGNVLGEVIGRRASRSWSHQSR